MQRMKPSKFVAIGVLQMEFCRLRPNEQIKLLGFEKVYFGFGESSVPMTL